MIPQDEYVKLRLEWPVICKLACKALITGVDFETICNHALEDGMRFLEEFKNAY